nr:hypothetical protein 23 [bacterium]
MTVVDACVTKQELAHAALNGIIQTLEDHGLKLEMTSDWDLFQAVYDCCESIEVETIN